MVDNLHFDNSNFNWTFMLDENGNQFASRIDGDPDFTEHDVQTGTRIDGTAFTDGSDMTCSNWTSNGSGSAHVGHFDRTGGGQNPTSWNSAHGSRGCSQSDLVGTGGNGYFYCFAID